MYNPHASFQSAQPQPQQSPATPTPESPWKQALCCKDVQAHRPILTRWEAQFDAFLAWLEHNGKRPEVTPPSQLDNGGDYEFVIRATTTINFGRMCGYMDYGLVRAAAGDYFQGVPPTFARGQGYLTRAAFKNYACQKHNLYFQLDIYVKTTTTVPAH